MNLATLRSETALVSVDPAFGARVVGLQDLRSGREWLSTGPRSTGTGEDAVFGEAQAKGWDECFPTVAPCDAGGTAWNRRLRDHGDLWGRPWSFSQAGNRLTAWFEGAGFRFERVLSLAGARLEAAYAVANTGTGTLPYLWAQHALLALRPGERIDLPGVDAVTVTQAERDGRPVEHLTGRWPNLSPSLPFTLDRVEETGACFAAKLYAPVAGAFRARVGGTDGWLAIGWQGGEVEAVGIWLAYGGWPQNGSAVHQVAVEATTAGADSLADALGTGRHRLLAPGEIHRWTVVMELEPPASA